MRWENQALPWNGAACMGFTKRGRKARCSGVPLDLFWEWTHDSPIEQHSSLAKLIGPRPHTLPTSVPSEMPAAEGAASARPDSPAGVTGPAAYKSQRTEYAPSYRPAPGSLPQGFVPVLQGGSPASLAGKQGSEDEFGQDLSPVDVLHRHDSGLSSLLRSVPSAHDSPDTPRSTSSPEAGAGGYAPAHAGAGAGLSRLARAGGEGTPRPSGPARAVPDAARPTALTAAAMGPRRRPHCPTKSTKAVPTGENGVFTSLFRGVTKHRLTGRYEAHFWDASHKRETKVRWVWVLNRAGAREGWEHCRETAHPEARVRCIRTPSHPPMMGIIQPPHPCRLSPQGKGGRTRGRQVYLGGYTSEEEAARAYDLAALAFLGAAAAINVRFAVAKRCRRGVLAIIDEYMGADLMQCRRHHLNPFPVAMT